MFYPDGLDWRWRSYGEVAEAVALNGAAGEASVGEESVDGEPRAGGPTADELTAWLAAGGAVHPGGERLAALTAEAATQRHRQGRHRQEVAILACPLSDPHASLLVTWSLLAGAALLLEPDPAALVATAVWARPSLFLGDDDDIRRLAAEVEGGAPSPLAALANLGRRLLGALGAHPAPALPLARLHTVLRAAAGRETGSDGTPWRLRGVRVLDAADFLG